MLVKCMPMNCLKLNINMRYAETLYYPFVLDRYYVLNTHSRQDWGNSARKYTWKQLGFLAKNMEIIIQQ